MLESLLVPLDGSLLAEIVLSHVVALARTFASHVTLLHVLEQNLHIDPSPAVDPLTWQFNKAEAAAQLDNVRTRLQQAGLKVETVLLEGHAAERIVDFAQTHHVSLIVLSSHARSGISRWNISSVVQKIVLSAPTSLMIVRAHQTVVPDLTGQQYRRLLVPLDGSWRAEAVMALAIQLSRTHHGALRLTQVISRPEVVGRRPPTQEDLELVHQLIERNVDEATHYLEQLVSRLPVEGLDVQTEVVTGLNILTTIHDFIDREHIDLVIMSAHGNSGEGRWPYGSLANHFIVYGATPLLIVQDLPSSMSEPTQAEAAVREHPGR
jgi:nucleotide-binding universal stress UspA family protein